MPPPSISITCKLPQEEEQFFQKKKTSTKRTNFSRIIFTQKDLQGNQNQHTKIPHKTCKKYTQTGSKNFDPNSNQTTHYNNRPKPQKSAIPKHHRNQHVSSQSNTTQPSIQTNSLKTPISQHNQHHIRHKRPQIAYITNP
jgi:hypothetical protein